MDSATKRMNAEQRQHVLQPGGQSSRPCGGYPRLCRPARAAGLQGPADRRGAGVEGQAPEAQIDTSQLAQHIAQLNQYGQEVNASGAARDVHGEQGRLCRRSMARLPMTRWTRRSIALAQSGHPAGAAIRAGGPDQSRACRDGGAAALPARGGEAAGPAAAGAAAANGLPVQPCEPAQRGPAGGSWLRRADAAQQHIQELTMTVDPQSSSVTPTATSRRVRGGRVAGTRNKLSHAFLRMP